MLRKALTQILRNHYGVQILSGGQEHGRADDGKTMHEQVQTYRQVTIGRGAWIGTNAVIMADIGEGAIIGAGAVVNKPIPAHCVAAGVPARVVKQLQAADASGNGDPSQEAITTAQG